MDPETATFSSPTKRKRSLSRRKQEARSRTRTDDPFLTMDRTAARCCCRMHRDAALHAISGAKSAETRGAALGIVGHSGVRLVFVGWPNTTASARGRQRAAPRYQPLSVADASHVIPRGADARALTWSGPSRSSSERRMRNEPLDPCVRTVPRHSTRRSCTSTSRQTRAWRALDLELDPDRAVARPQPELRCRPLAARSGDPRLAPITVTVLGQHRSGGDKQCESEDACRRGWGSRNHREKPSPPAAHTAIGLWSR